MYSFLVSNNLIEQNIQKGFTPNLCGTLEHTAQMANIINKSRFGNALLSSPYLTLKMPSAKFIIILSNQYLTIIISLIMLNSL